jgi:hypothetical protein
MSTAPPVRVRRHGNGYPIIYAPAHSLRTMSTVRREMAKIAASMRFSTGLGASRRSRFPGAGSVHVSEVAHEQFK